MPNAAYAASWKARWLLCLCLCFFGACSSSDRHDKEAPAPTLIRGVYWFGQGWPPNFWTTDVLGTADEDFRQMKNDGFNTVFLIVPWEGFVDPETGKISSRHFEMLDQLVAKAKDAHLNLGLRIAYAHNTGYDSYSDTSKLFTSSHTYNAWLEFMREIGQRYNKDDAIVKRLISWEDLWEETGVANASLPDRLAFGRNSDFQDFVSHQIDLEAASKLYKANFSSWKDVPIPQRDSPAFSIFLDYLKDAFQKRFYDPAVARVKDLSFELRIDADPIFDGTKVLRAYDWSSSWAPLSQKEAVVYFNPYYGADNTGHAISPQRALLGLNWMLGQIRRSVGAKPIFISQFNLRDDTPEFHSDYVSDADLPDFLRLSESAIRGTNGYAFWFFRGYYHNMLSNPDFSQGLDDWQSRGHAELRRDSVRLPPEAWLQRSFKGSEHLNPLTLCVTMQGLAAGSGLEISGNVDNPVSYDAAAPTNTMTTTCKSVAGQSEFKLTAYGGGVEISLVKLFNFYQKGSIYKFDGSPGVLLDATRAFNHEVLRKGRL